MQLNRQNTMKGNSSMGVHSNMHDHMENTILLYLYGICTGRPILTILTIYYIDYNTGRLYWYICTGRPIV